MSREPSGITILVDGNPTDLADVTWLEVAPCGCASGCTVAYLPPPYSVTKATAEQAADDYYETRAGRAQQERRGFTIVAIHRERLKEFLNQDCLHIPKWGYERPRPDGMRWAASKWGAGKTLHLVYAEAVDSDKPARTQPLCKGAESYGWSAERIGGQPDCEKCIKAASAQGVLA